MIAEALQRQKRAEQDRDHWKERAQRERRRTKAVIAAVNNRPLAPLPVTADGFPPWDNVTRVVHMFVDTITDPYAAFQDDEDGYMDMTHAQARDMLTSLIQNLVHETLRTERAKLGTIRDSKLD